MKLFARGGQLGLSELTDTGEVAFVPLERIRIHGARSKAGTYRWYSDHRLPDDHGGGTITARLHGNNDDAKRKFNRTENVRPIPADDPDFDRLYARRNDAESINRHLDDDPWPPESLLLVRSPSFRRAPTAVHYAPIGEFVPESASASALPTDTITCRSSGRQAREVFSQLFCRSRPDSSVGRATHS